MSAGSESPGLVGPTYISAHSADVILSDIRPIQLKLEALSSINVLLDELLWSILHVSRSLTTDRLKAGLLKVLPTPLGKEALLEAEVELRAYWERTNASKPGASQRTVDDEKEFSLEWAFELLRLKCVAYSTLNDVDEDLNAETRLQERMAQAGGLSAPKVSLVAPAALYLTAILEAICEHILSNVGRVAARDSTKTTAAVHDVFVALCEDDAIYGLFKSMQVYDQIEALSKVVKPRRSKSFSRSSDKAASPSRTASPNQDFPLAKDSSSGHARSRISSESSTSNATPLGTGAGGQPPRPSFEKARAMKMFMSHSRNASDNKSNGAGQEQNGHKKTDSVRTSGSKNTLPTSLDLDDEDMQEFDDMMRSGATMKVSLTPDRLKTMEVHNKDKHRRDGRRVDGKATPTEAVPIPSPTNKTEDSSPGSPHRSPDTRRPSLIRNVHSILEDDEEQRPAKVHMSRSVPLETSVSSSRNHSPHPPVASAARLRSISTSNMLDSKPPAAVVRKMSHDALPSSTSQRPQRSVPKPLDTTGQPTRTRKVGRNRESLDLDDIMGGSDDDDDLPLASSKPPLTPKTPKAGNGQPALSARTRELIDFLSEGPPEMPPPVIPSGPSMVSLGTTKSRQSGLRRMMSKLTNLGGNDHLHVKASSDSLVASSSPRRNTTNSSLHQSSVSSRNGAAAVIVMTRPPRPPPVQPISPPSSPSPSPAEDIVSPLSRSPPPSFSKKTVPAWERLDNEATSPSFTSPPRNSGSPVPGPSILKVSTTPTSRRTPSPAHSSDEQTPRSKPIHSTTSVHSSSAKERPSHVRREPSPLRTVPSAKTADEPSEVNKSDAALKANVAGELKELQKVLANATTADECRLLVDMFIARSGLATEAAQTENPYPSPSPSLHLPLPSEDLGMETSLVELLLGGDTVGEVSDEKSSTTEDPPIEPAVVTPRTPSGPHRDESRRRQGMVQLDSNKYPLPSLNIPAPVAMVV
ncbi:hypothetical protein JAAARDRAFT_27755 [Jaapia argillacea MUCL 33604]|uniref:Uncharacterized protein n=1 Tax=Jaapia argillacea MUCL 33604 TaxID=933084 RepID=A0A067QKU1_9AGAM|nr:hypothetical protein JAAARDRAFT_27755 [Jaapia argillacea MUCL 33604]